MNSRGFRPPTFTNQLNCQPGRNAVDGPLPELSDRRSTVVTLLGRTPKNRIYDGMPEAEVLHMFAIDERPRVEANAPFLLSLYQLLVLLREGRMKMYAAFGLCPVRARPKCSPIAGAPSSAARNPPD